jgi:tRNA-2-methylthio-N6-dimethylallyladenosine synthase
LEQLQRQRQKDIYRNYIGREIKVLVETVSSKSEGDFTGHSTCHKVVNFPKGTATLGEVTTVRVTETKPNSLYGEAVTAA